MGSPRYECTSLLSSTSCLCGYQYMCLCQVIVGYPRKKYISVPKYNVHSRFVSFLRIFTGICLAYWNVIKLFLVVCGVFSCVSESTDAPQILQHPPSTTPRHSFSARSHSGRICKSLQQPQDIICFKTTTAIWFTSRVLNAIKRVNLFLNSFHQTLFQRLDRLSWLRQLSPQLTSGHLQTT